jgi:hypothetical protein
MFTLKQGRGGGIYFLNETSAYAGDAGILLLTKEKLTILILKDSILELNIFL